MTEHDETDPRFRLRQNRSDPLYDQQLQRDAQAVNEQTARALGPLPPGGLPVQAKRRPDIRRPEAPTERAFKQDMNMSKTIDAEKLKAAAEHLEWVLNQYSENGDVRKLLSAMSVIINEAKAGMISVPTEMIPCRHLITEGIYRDFENPSVESAYYSFATEMRGGPTKREVERQARMEAAWQALKGSGGSE